jgi:hypothetical protein
MLPRKTRSSMTNAEKDAARAALGDWADASLVVLEVKAGHATSAWHL